MERRELSSAARDTHRGRTDRPPPRYGVSCQSLVLPGQISNQAPPAPPTLVKDTSIDDGPPSNSDPETDNLEASNHDIDFLEVDPSDTDRCCVVTTLEDTPTKKKCVWMLDSKKSLSGLVSDNGQVADSVVEPLALNEREAPVDTISGDLVGDQEISMVRHNSDPDTRSSRNIVPSTPLKPNRLSSSNNVDTDQFRNSTPLPGFPLLSMTTSSSRPQLASTGPDLGTIDACDTSLIQRLVSTLTSGQPDPDLHLSASDMRGMRPRKLLAHAVRVAENILEHSQPSAKEQLHEAFAGKLYRSLQVSMETRDRLGSQVAGCFDPGDLDFGLTGNGVSSLADVYFKVYTTRVKDALRGNRRAKHVRKELAECCAGLLEACRQWSRHGQSSQLTDSMGRSMPPATCLLTPPSSQIPEIRSRDLLHHFLRDMEAVILGAEPCYRRCMMKRVTERLSLLLANLSVVSNLLKTDDHTLRLNIHLPIPDSSATPTDVHLAEFIRRVHGKVATARHVRDMVKVVTKARHRVRAATETWLKDCKNMAGRARLDDRREFDRIKKLQAKLSFVGKRYLLVGLLREAKLAARSSYGIVIDTVCEVCCRLHAVLDQVRRIQTRAERSGTGLFDRDDAVPLLQHFLEDHPERLATPVQIYFNTYVTRVHKRLSFLDTTMAVVQVCEKTQKAISHILQKWPPRVDSFIEGRTKSNTSQLASSVIPNQSQETGESMGQKHQAVREAFLSLDGVVDRAVLDKFLDAIKAHARSLSNQHQDRVDFVELVKHIDTCFRRSLSDLAQLEQEILDVARGEIEMADILSRVSWEQRHTELLSMAQGPGSDSQPRHLGSDSQPRHLGSDSQGRHLGSDSQQRHLTFEVYLVVHLRQLHRKLANKKSIQAARKTITLAHSWQKETVDALRQIALDM